MRFTFLPALTLLFLFLLPFKIAAQQTHNISGTILQAAKKSPVPGAGITNLKTNTTISASESGMFKLNAAPQDTLLIRAVGYKPLVYVVGDQREVILVLEQSSVKLTEIEVRSRPEPVKAVSTQARRPGYDPALDPPPPPPAPLPSKILNPVSAFSKEGRQKRELSKLNKLQKKEKVKQQAEQQKEDYNKFFKDNTGYQ